MLVGFAGLSNGKEAATVSHIRLRVVVFVLLGLGMHESARISAEPSTPSTHKPQPEPEKKPEADAARYSLPGGGPCELIPFVLRLRREDTATDDYPRKIAAIIAAGRRIHATSTEADRKLEDYDQAMGICLYLWAFEAKSNEERTALIQVASEHLATSGSASREAVGAAMVMIEWYAKDPDRMAELCRTFVEAITNSHDHQATRHIQELKGTVRRLTLVGRTMDFTGTKMDGSRFDVTELRGKVVLVDFWATWCGPCLGEVPNMRRNFARYHDRGFEIVGVSMDEDRDALVTHLAKENYPWTTLHDSLKLDQHVAVEYGITSLPTLILIDRQGKVVSANARGDSLGKLLHELFGAPEQAAIAR